MASIWQITWEWTGLPGLSGYTNLHYAAPAATPAEALSAATKSRLLFAGLPTQFPSALSISPTGEARLLDETTGDLVDVVSYSGPTPVTGSAGTVAYSAASGGAIAWPTAVVHGKHIMVGKTFLVPFALAAYSATGGMTPASLTNMGTAAEAMRTATGPTFLVWGRPRKAKTVGGVTIPALSGLAAAALSSRALTKAVVLRSRRD